MEQTIAPSVETLDPATEVSFLIRSSEDAVRIAEALESFCINDMDGERLAEIEELLSLVRHWDAPLVPEAWTRISDLCSEILDEVRDYGSGEEPGWYDLIIHALRYAAERKCLAQLTPEKGDDLK